jgi:RimJ/RimL family protein N-acetyltransferase
MNRNWTVTVTERLRSLGAVSYPRWIALHAHSSSNVAAWRELSLREATDEDVPYLSSLAADPEVEPFLAFGAADEDRMRSLIAAAGPAPGSGGLLVVESEEQETLGAIGLTLVNTRCGICEVSRVMVRPDRRRSGIAATAIWLASRQALVEHEMHRVQAECYGDNAAAHRLFERVGFTREGTRRRAYWRRGGWLDGVLFGLLAEELPHEAP